MLTKDQEVFLKDFTEKRTILRYEKLWGEEYMRRTDTEKGTIDIDLRKIRYVDMGAVAEHCDCGQAIRYVYLYKHNDELFTMGSTCIQRFTGLAGKDVKMIINGSIETNKERSETVNILKKQTYEQWLRVNPVIKKALEKIDKLDFSDCEHDKEMILGFTNNKLPLPRYFKAVLTRKYYNLKRAEEMAQWEKENQEKAKAFEKAIGNRVAVIEKARWIADNPEYDDIYKGPISIIKDILIKLKRYGNLSDKQIGFLDKLNRRVEDPKQIQAARILADLDTLIKNHTIKDNRSINMIDSLRIQMSKAGLSDKQLDLILKEDFTTKGGKKMKGLACRFETELAELDQQRLEESAVTIEVKEPVNEAPKEEKKDEIEFIEIEI
jgi:hypothetical protein